VGLVARRIEELGVPTVCLNLLWTFQRIVGMPRVAAVEHPFGRPFGDVGDAATQRAVLLAALEVAEAAGEPGAVAHLPFVWHEDPRDTRWHPPEPAPIIRLMKAQLAEKA
jgi:hypothetical protein